MSNVLWIRTWDDLKELWERDNAGIGMGIEPKTLTISLPQNRHIHFHPEFPHGDLERK